MNKMNKFINLIILLIFASCGKEPNVIPKNETPTAVPPYKKFLGTYQVENLNTGEQYQMKIGIQSDTLTNDNIVDSLDIKNFDNNFDYKYPFKKYENENFIQIIWHFGIRDRNNNSWAVFQEWDDTTTSIKENTLINDTIIFYFRKTNIAFWPSDGVLYYECYCKHRAVKVSDEY
jgi:hypothetical protein